MFRTFEVQHAHVIQMQLRMCVVEKGTSMKIFLQTETPVSPVWSSDELILQKVSVSGGCAADGGDLVERNLFCDQFDAAAASDEHSAIGDKGASGASSSAAPISSSQSAAEKGRAAAKRSAG